MPIRRWRIWFCVVAVVLGVSSDIVVEVGVSKRGRRKAGIRAGNGWLDFVVVFFAGSKAA
jgi:hypothetical protein